MNIDKKMKLIRPNAKYLESYLQAFDEDEKYSPNLERVFSNDRNIIERTQNLENGINLPKDYVKATTFWLVDENEFLGEINIRHELTPWLLCYGGHVGYEIRYSKRRMGFGTLMLKMALPYCRDVLKLKRVLITCDDENEGSARIIEKCGGVLENKQLNKTERGLVLTRRYWITL